MGVSWFRLPAHFGIRPVSFDPHRSVFVLLVIPAYIPASPRALIDRVVKTSLDFRSNSSEIKAGSKFRESRSGVMDGGGSGTGPPALGRGAAVRLAGDLLQVGEAVLHAGLVHIGSEHQAAEAHRTNLLKKFLKHGKYLLFNCRGERFTSSRI